MSLGRETQHSCYQTSFPFRELPPKSLTEFAELPGRQVSDRGGVRCG